MFLLMTAGGSARQTVKGSDRPEITEEKELERKGDWSIVCEDKKVSLWCSW